MMVVFHRIFHRSRVVVPMLLIINAVIFGVYFVMKDASCVKLSPTRLQNKDHERSKSNDDGEDTGTSKVTENNSKPDMIIERQLRRRGRVADVCAARLLVDYANSQSDLRHNLTENGLPVPVEFDNLLTDDERRILYCEVPKVACTNWKKTLIFLTGVTNASSADEVHDFAHSLLGEKVLPRLSKYSPTEIQYRLNTYFKFIFVRDPLDRLLSAYIDKFLPGNNRLFEDLYGRRIIAKYRHNTTKESLQKNHVRLNEFVKYLIDPSTIGIQRTHHRGHWYGMNVHWRSFEELCHPCFVGYDFIGKYETLYDDAEHVIKLIGGHGLVRFPRSSSKRQSRQMKRSSSAIPRQSAVRGYDGIPFSEMKRLIQLYDDDYTLFGYPHPI